MGTYFLTVYSPTGEKLLNVSFEAENDTEAKKIGEKRLLEESYHNYTSRLTCSGKLILFHR